MANDIQRQPSAWDTPAVCDVCHGGVGADGERERCAPFRALCARCFAGYLYAMGEQVRMGVAMGRVDQIIKAKREGRE